MVLGLCLAFRYGAALFRSCSCYTGLYLNRSLAKRPSAARAAVVADVRREAVRRDANSASANQLQE